MTDKVAIVTGASSGIGAATARELHGAGYIVYAAARRTERMAPLAAAGMRTVAMDLTVEESMTAGIEHALAEAGRIDVLVNNAGYGSFGSLEDVPASEARHQFEVNVFGPARLTQLVLPTMRAQGSGRVVNVSSIGGKIYEPLGDWYHAAKFALEGLSDSLRVELRPFGIDVVVIEPGAIRSEWSGIAAANLRERSATGPYARQAAAMANVLAVYDRRPWLISPPEVVARAVLAAVSARRPKPSYVAGRGAKAILLARRALPDRGFDRALQVLYRLPSWR
jgi:NAD(P)-dependent dehydrogenase (short-subunit alcohol dehydrogenase family)